MQFFVSTSSAPKYIVDIVLNSLKDLDTMTTAIDTGNAVHIKNIHTAIGDLLSVMRKMVAGGKVPKSELPYYIIMMDLYTHFLHFATDPSDSNRTQLTRLRNRLLAAVGKNPFSIVR